MFRFPSRGTRCTVLLALMAGSLLSLSAPPLHAQSSPRNAFDKLIELSHQRLEISRKVALTKWDNNLTVADPPNDPREQQVIDAAAKTASERGLSTELAASFFADQIEASKLVQFALIASWRRDQRAPAEARSDLKTVLRPALDQLKASFIEELVVLDNRKLLAAGDCKAQLSNAVGQYVVQRKLEPMQAIALDRGLARVCGAA